MTDGTFRHPLSWRSRLFRAFAALVLLVLATRLIWGAYAGRKLAARLDGLRHQNQPVDVTDVAYEAVRDAENAWDYQIRAAQSIVNGVDSPASSNLEYNDYPPYPTAWWQLAEGSERAHGKVFSLARQARQYSRVQLRAGLMSPMVTMLLPYLNQARHLANIVGDGALYAHLTGNDVEALERLRDLLHLGRSLHQDDFRVSQLVAMGVDSIAYQRALVIAPGLRLGRADTAARDQAAALILELLDEEAYWSGISRTNGIERLAAIDITRTQSAATWFIRPLADLQILRDLDNLQLAVAAGHARTHPDAMAALAQVRAEPVHPTASPSFGGNFAGGKPNPVPRYSRWFHTGMSNSFSRYVDTTCRTVADRRVTAVSLAAQVYRADHNGAWPTALSDLVPAYLPTLPADPFHADGRPLGYVVARLPDGAPRPLVFYNAGPQATPPFGPEPIYGWQAGPRGQRVIRQYRDLSRFAPPPPSTQAVGDNPEESN